MIISTPFKNKILIPFSRLKYVRPREKFSLFSLSDVNHIKKCARSPGYNDIVRGGGGSKLCAAGNPR